MFDARFTTDPAGRPARPADVVPVGPSGEGTRRYWLRRLGAVGLAVAMFLGGVGFERATTAATAAATTEPASGRVDTEDFALIGQAWDLLYREYVDAANLDPSVLAHGAIEGMADAVGDTGHTYLLTADEAADQDQALSSSPDGSDTPVVAWAMVPRTKVALINLAVFAEGSAGKVRGAVVEATAAGATGLILDLRGNPGGWADEAVGVASVFLRAGEVVLRDREPDGTEYEIDAQPDASATRLPMVVLVDGDSASCAEVVAGALRETHRARLVGTTTFGTGTMTTDFPLADGSVLSIGTSEWLTPAGRSAWHVGVAPDVRVELAPGIALVRPDQLAALGPKGLAKSGDSQLLRAIEILRAGGG
jgi:C-terminal processing protease CtpA/Prc